MPSLICWIAIYPLVSIICDIQLGPGCFLCTLGKNYCFVLRINFIVSKQDYEVKEKIYSHTGDEILYLGMKLNCTIYKCNHLKVNKKGSSPYIQTDAKKNWIERSACLNYIMYKKCTSYSTLLCDFSVIDHRWRQNVARTTKKWYKAQLSTSLVFLPHFDIFWYLLLNRPMAIGNLIILYKIVAKYH